MSTARDDILRRIRGALQDIPPTEQPSNIPVPRDYRHQVEAAHALLVEQFAERVAEYKATVHRLPASDLPTAIAAALARRGAKRIVIPADFQIADLPTEVTFLRDEGLSHAELDQSDGVLTGCALGIAETGTIVLNGGAGQGRRAITLLPDYHLCIVWESQVVGGVPEAITALGTDLHASWRPITFISGPSATSDIELNRVEGVHGPRTLEVLIVSN